MSKNTISTKVKDELNDKIKSKLEDMDEDKSEFARKALKQRIRRLTDE